MGRGTVNRQVQVGIEVTSGTPVPANRLLPSMSFVLNPEIVNRQYRAQGFRGITANKITQFDGGADLSGPLNYSEIVYPLNTIVTGVITTPSGGTNSRRHTFSPVAAGTDSYKTLTIQEGDPTAAVQMAHAAVVDFGISVTEDASDISGTVVGHAPTNVTLTASPTSVLQLPIGPREIDVYIDPTFGALGTTKVSDALGFEFNVASLRVKKHVLNTTYQSFKDLTDAPVDLSAAFTTEHNLQSRNIFAGVTTTSNPIQYVRLKATGPIIEGVIPYSVQLDIAARIIDMDQQDTNNVWGYRYALVPEYDGSFGNKLFEIQVVNTITAATL